MCKRNLRHVSQHYTRIAKTVKPIALLEYLCKLTSTPTGGIVLDPFAGSGSTGLACQNIGREYVLIEREPEYVEIIKNRLKGNKGIVEVKNTHNISSAPLPATITPKVPKERDYKKDLEWLIGKK